jgi:hypothetical protein
VIESKLDRGGIRSGRNDEIVFKAPFMAVENQVHARIDVTPRKAPVVGDIAHPARRIGSDEIGRAIRQCIQRFEARLRSRTRESQANYRGAFSSELKGQAVIGHCDICAGRPRQVMDILLDRHLTGVGFEEEFAKGRVRGSRSNWD